MWSSQLEAKPLIPTSWTDKWQRKGGEVPGGKGLASAHPTSHSHYPTPTLLRPREALHANQASGVALTVPCVAARPGHN